MTTVNSDASAIAKTEPLTNIDQVAGFIALSAMIKNRRRSGIGNPLKRLVHCTDGLVVRSPDSALRPRGASAISAAPAAIGTIGV